MGLFLSIALAGICYAIFLALLTSPFISIFQKCDEISHLLWSPLSFTLSLCLYHFYSFILTLVRFWEKAEIKARVQFAIFNQKSPVPMNYSTNCKLAFAPYEYIETVLLKVTNGLFDKAISSQSFPSEALFFWPLL